MGALAVKRRDRVTGAFLARAGGYFEMDRRLFQVVRVSEDCNERMIEAEDCWAPCGWPILELEREVVVRCGRVVRWPPGL